MASQLGGESRLAEALQSGGALLLEVEWASEQELASASGQEESSLRKSDTHQGFHRRYIRSASRQEESLCQRA